MSSNSFYSQCKIDYSASSPEFARWFL